MRASIKRQLLLPFAAGLAALAVAIGVGSVLAARGAANDELGARAERAEQLAHDTLERTRERLASDSLLLGRLLTERASPAQLENRVVRFSVERDLSHVSLVDPDGRVIGGDGRADWVKLPLANTLRRRAAARSPASATGVSDRGEPLILAASSVRQPIGETTIMLGRAIDRDVLAPVERSLGVIFHVETKTASGKPSRGAGSLQEDGTRTVAAPLRLSEPDGASARLLVSMSSRRLSAATWSILMVTGGAGVLVLMVLLGFLQALLGRSVISPVRKLAGGIERVREGKHATRVTVEGAEELRLLTEGFNDMAATVGAQHRRLEYLAGTDPLTGVANHRRFHDALGRAVAAAERGAGALGIVILDLDHFKSLNDAHGHSYGDEVLRLVGARLREAVRESDLVGRVGGEEFALLLPGATAETAEEIAERARSAVEEIELTGVALGCSAGVAVFPDDTLHGREMLSLADAALYLAKNAGRGQTHRFDARHATILSPEQQQQAVQELLSNPERAVPVFQPIVSLSEGRIVGYEALTRFDDPSGRTPHEWFTLARLCGLGSQLQALAAGRALAVPGRPAGTYLSLNLEPSSLGSAAFEEVLPADLSGILIEITEQELIADHARLVDELSALRNRGARIALDDTGAGYSGLRHVTLIRPDVIKLDRALVENLDADPGKLALLESFTTFARRTDAQVCAEGIESDAELDALAELGVDLGQGYRLAPPGPPWPSMEPGVADGLRRRERLPNVFGPDGTPGVAGPDRNGTQVKRVPETADAIQGPGRAPVAPVFTRPHSAHE